MACMRTAAGLLLAPLLLAATCMAQSEAPPGNIRLLPGYLHQRGQGFDSKVGTIARREGLTIEYDIGPMAGDYTDRKWDGEIWRKNQIINGHPIVVVFTKANLLVISFPGRNANFLATIRSDSEMADMLLMVLTYSPE